MFRCIHEQLRATSVPHLESAFHSHSPSTYIVGTAVINIASKVHLHIHMPKKAGPKETPPPAHAAAPHRTAAISRTEKPIPKRPESTTTTHTENRSPLPHHFSIRSPNLGRLFALPELSCRFLNLFLSCQGLFPLTLAPIPFTARRTTGSSFSPSGISPLLLAPHQCHHTTSQAARSSRRIKRQPNERAFLRRVCVLLVIWDFSLSGHSVSVTPRKTPDTRRLKRILATRKYDKRFLAAIAT
jgi:hypothetical protein